MPPFERETHPRFLRLYHSPCDQFHDPTLMQPAVRILPSPHEDARHALTVGKKTENMVRASRRSGTTVTRRLKHELKAREKEHSEPHHCSLENAQLEHTDSLVNAFPVVLSGLEWAKVRLANEPDYYHALVLDGFWLPCTQALFGHCVTLLGTLQVKVQDTFHSTCTNCRDRPGATLGGWRC